MDDTQVSTITAHNTFVQPWLTRVAGYSNSSHACDLATETSYYIITIFGHCFEGLWQLELLA